MRQRLIAAVPQYLMLYSRRVVLSCLRLACLTRLLLHLTLQLNWWMGWQVATIQYR